MKKLYVFSGDPDKWIKKYVKYCFVYKNIRPKNKYVVSLVTWETGRVSYIMSKFMKPHCVKSFTSLYHTKKLSLIISYYINTKYCYDG